MAGEKKKNWDQNLTPEPRNVPLKKIKKTFPSDATTIHKLRVTMPGIVI